MLKLENVRNAYGAIVAVDNLTLTVRRITKSVVVRERRGPSNGFDVTFPQGVVWGIIGCVMTFAIGLVSERARTSVNPVRNPRQEPPVRKSQ